MQKRVKCCLVSFSPWRPRPAGCQDGQIHSTSVHKWENCCCKGKSLYFKECKVFQELKLKKERLSRYTEFLKLQLNLNKCTSSGWMKSCFLWSTCTRDHSPPSGLPPVQPTVFRFLFLQNSWAQTRLACCYFWAAVQDQFTTGTHAAACCLFVLFSLNPVVRTEQ